METNTTPPVINAMCWAWCRGRQQIWESLKQERWKLLKESVPRDDYYKMKDEIRRL